MRETRLLLAFVAILGTCVAEAQGRWFLAPNTGSNPFAPLCRTLAKRLNSTQGACVRDALETYPGFSEPPWNALDPKQHFDLLIKLIAVARGLAPQYTGHELTTGQSKNLRSLAGQFMENGGQLKLWHARLLDHFGPELEKPAPPGDQTVIVMITNTRFFPANTGSQCPGISSKGWLRQTFIVSRDLSGPDWNVDRIIASHLVNAHPVLYRDTPLLIYDQFPFVAPYKGPIFIDAVPRGGGCYLELSP